MRRFGTRSMPVEEEELVNVTAMVDVVFILLSFFVLTTRFIGGERELGIGAAAETAAPGMRAEDLPASVRIELSRGAGGGVAIRMGQVQLTEDAFGQLTARLRELDLPGLPVVLAADESLPVAAVARGIEAVLAGPNRNVSLTTRQRAPGAGEGSDG